MSTVDKLRAKRSRRPIYMHVLPAIDRDTGEEFLAFRASHPIDRRLMKERGFRRGDELRVEVKRKRNVKFHRLAHALGNLLVDNVEKFLGKGGHEALKEVQRESGVCCDTMDIDLGALGIVPVKVPRSLAFDEMEEDEFARFFEGITAHIAEHYASVMLDEVRAEFWLMVNGEER